MAKTGDRSETYPTGRTRTRAIQPCLLARPPPLGYEIEILAEGPSRRESHSRETERMNPRRLFVASCIALVASAFSFVIRGDILPALGSTFDLNQASRGAIAGYAFLGMAISMFIGAPICDALGMKRMLGLAFLCHLLGSLLTVGAPYLVPSGSDVESRVRIAYWILSAAMLLVGSANGFV